MVTLTTLNRHNDNMQEERATMNILTARTMNVALHISLNRYYLEPSEGWRTSPRWNGRTNNPAGQDEIQETMGKRTTEQKVLWFVGSYVPLEGKQFKETKQRNPSSLQSFVWHPKPEFLWAQRDCSEPQQTWSIALPQVVCSSCYGSAYANTQPAPMHILSTYMHKRHPTVCVCSACQHKCVKGHPIDKTTGMQIHGPACRNTYRVHRVWNCSSIHTVTTPSHQPTPHTSTGTTSINIPHWARWCITLTLGLRWKHSISIQPAQVAAQKLCLTTKKQNPHDTMESISEHIQTQINH